MMNSYKIHLSDMELESMIERHDSDIENSEITTYVTNTRKWSWRDMNNLLFNGEKERREAGSTN